MRDVGNALKPALLGIVLAAVFLLLVHNAGSLEPRPLLARPEPADRRERAPHEPTRSEVLEDGGRRPSRARIREREPRIAKGFEDGRQLGLGFVGHPGGVRFQEALRAGERVDERSMRAPFDGQEDAGRLDGFDEGPHGHARLRVPVSPCRAR